MTVMRNATVMIRQGIEMRCMIVDYQGNSEGKKKEEEKWC